MDSLRLSPTRQHRLSIHLLSPYSSPPHLPHLRVLQHNLKKLSSSDRVQFLHFVCLSQVAHLAQSQTGCRQEHVLHYLLEHHQAQQQAQ